MIFLLRKLVLHLHKFFVVFKHSFLTNFKSKSFIITTVISMLLIVGIFGISNLISYYDEKDSAEKIGVIDFTENTFESLSQQITVFSDQIEFVSFEEEKNAINQFENNELYAYLIIQSADNGLIDVTYKAENINNSNLINKIEQALSQVQFQTTATTLNLSGEEINLLFQNVNMEKISLDENAKSESEIFQSYILVYIILFAMYFGVLMYANMVATEVAKEKTSRIMEILISSVNPIAQMFGKILGISLLGIFQISGILLVGLLSMKIFPTSISFGDFAFDLSQISADIIFYAIVFYILGYLLYASLAAMLGSLVSRIEDLQQMIGPFNMILVAAFIIAMYGLSNPDSSLIVGASYFPFFTPLIMFLRVGMSDPFLWEIWLSILILLASIILFSMFSAKVYKGGVLLYGKNSAIKTIKRALSFNKDS